jgi:hypothetical protein
MTDPEQPEILTIFSTPTGSNNCCIRPLCPKAERSTNDPMYEGIANGSMASTPNKLRQGRSERSRSQAIGTAIQRDVVVTAKTIQRVRQTTGPVESVVTYSRKRDGERLS